MDFHLTPESTVEQIQQAIESLRKEHAEYDARVVALDEQNWLSTEEQVERKQSQKMKLKLKDKIQELTNALEEKSK